MASHLDALKAVAVTAEIFGKELSGHAASTLMADLNSFGPDEIIEALVRCRRELRFFPTVADIVARIPDSRPGVEEAWAMLPQDENVSVVWTTEMQEAFGTVRHLIAEDPIAARMAFRETYLRLMNEARAAKRPAIWQPSLGHDLTTHEPALRAAAAKGQISLEHATALLPERPTLSLEALSANVPRSMTPDEVQDHIARIRAALTRSGDA